MATTGKLSFGIKTAPQHAAYEDIVRVWREVDRTAVFEHAWDFDHFIALGPDPTAPCLEGWTLLAALAAQTERLRVGVMVTGNTYRHPAVLANMGATVDIISHGRMDFGIGAGWNEAEHTAYGIPLYPPGERVRRLAEACEVIRRLWTEPAANYTGQYYQLQEARCEPKPVQQPHPPFVIGGSGERLTLRVAAQYADIWNFGGGSVDEFRRKMQVLDEHCASVERDPATVVRSVQLHVDPADLGAARAALRDYIGAGATHLILYLSPMLTAPYPRDIVPRLAGEVVEPLLSEQRGG